MDRVDYSWDDQDPEQMQAWHETEGSLLYREETERSLPYEGDLATKIIEEDSLDEETRDLLEIFFEWLDKRFSPLEIDILLSMPALAGNLEASHPVIARLMATHDLGLEELERRNLCLRVSVLEKLREDGLERLVAWQIMPYVDNDDAIKLYSEGCSETE